MKLGTKPENLFTKIDNVAECLVVVVELGKYVVVEAEKVVVGRLNAPGMIAKQSPLLMFRRFNTTYISSTPKIYISIWDKRNWSRERSKYKQHKVTMSELATLITQVSELTRANNIVPYDIDHMSQVSHVTTNMGRNTVVGVCNVQALWK